MARTITDVSGLVEALGGRVEVAKLLGIGGTAVSMWSERGIPTGWHLRLAIECGRRGLTIDPALFDLPAGALDGLVMSRDGRGAPGSASDGAADGRRRARV